MNTTSLKNLTLLAAVLGGVSACAEKPMVNKADEAIEKTLKAAEQDARTGNEKKAVEEIDAAEKALIKEDKAHPYPQPNKQWTGEDAKANADQDAFRQMEKAKKSAKSGLAGDAADEARAAEKDVEKREGR